jgi:hypothetical protein
LVVARRASRFSQGRGGFLPLDVDWRSASFSNELRSAMQAVQPISHALLWLHDPERVLSWLLPELTSARIVLVVGSLDGKPESPETAARIATVRLGSMPTASGRRWLTNEEISDGAIAALRDGRSRVVGELKPV